MLRGINTYPKKVVSSHTMRSILRHGDIEWDVEFLITTQVTTLDIAQYHEDINKLLQNDKKVFGDLPCGKPLDWGLEHIIELEIGTSPIKFHPYKHPKRFKDEIK